MATTRAEDVAEILWELKRAGKVATYSVIAKRAGFSAGANGRSVLTALKTVRRDWPHLQWWRAVQENGLVEKDSEHQEKLAETGFEITDVDGKDDVVCVAEFEEHVMEWETPETEAGAEEAVKE